MHLISSGKPRISEALREAFNIKGIYCEFNPLAGIHFFTTPQTLIILLTIV
jgi:hypothetical protein